MFAPYAFYPVLLWPLGPVILVWAVMAFNRVVNTRNRWPRINGIVTERKLQMHRVRMAGPMYWPKIVVTYYAGGRDYRATFQWDAGINHEYAKDLLENYREQSVTSLQYAPYDPSIAKLRDGKICSEAWTKFLILGSAGLLLSILTLLSMIINLLLSAPAQAIMVTATPLVK